MFGWFRKKATHPANDAVRQVLSEGGDDGTRVRHVIHFAYPLERANAVSKVAVKDCILSYVDVTFTETLDSEGVVFEHYREVASAEFDTLTDTMKHALEDKGWTYDGWECALETGAT